MWLSDCAAAPFDPLGVFVAGSGLRPDGFATMARWGTGLIGFGMAGPCCTSVAG